jgi:gluconolactonase
MDRPCESDWVRMQLRGAPTPIFLEGPSFDRDGNLWVVDIPWGRIFRITPQGDVTLAAQYDGEPTGLKFHRDGRAFIADHRHGIMVLDPRTGRVEPFLERSRLQRFKGCNDLFFASNGDLYFTDQGQTGLQDATGRLYRATPSGRLDCLIDNVPSPNGLVMDRDETAIYLAATRGNAVWRVPVLEDGTTSKAGIFVQMSGGGGPDGLALDEEGGLAVCHVGLGAVWLFDERGEPRFRIDSPVGLATTNCAYGGPARKQLYIVESKSGTILVADVPTAGRPLFSHADQRERMTTDGLREPPGAARPGGAS